MDGTEGMKTLELSKDDNPDHGRDHREVDITYHNGWIRRLLRKPVRIVPYAGSGTAWHNRETGQRASIGEEMALTAYIWLDVHKRLYRE